MDITLTNKKDNIFHIMGLVVLTHEFGPLGGGAEEWVLLWKGLRAPVTREDKQVGSGTLGRAFGPVERLHGPGGHEAGLQEYEEYLQQPTTGQVFRRHHLEEMEEWKSGCLRLLEGN